VEGDLEGARHLEEVDVRRRRAQLGDLAREALFDLVDEVLVPARLHEGDARLVVVHPGLSFFRIVTSATAVCLLTAMRT
jgi:hypothetical protein